ncbi:MAG TPA: C4-type zinc ribbon domain-containing protein [Actinomycetota bacterium]|nr:C4-type zinc ribbon domain-containing protein [Actinomycetota bacterium]
MMVEASRQSLLELLELQKIDSIIDRLTARLHNLPEQEELDSLEDRQRTLESRVGEREAALDEVAGRQRKLDTEIDNIGRKIAGEEARVNSGDISSPRELASVGAEIESLKRRRTRFEDEDLEVMEERENLEKELAGLRAELEALQAQVAQAIVRRDEAGGEVGQDLETARERKQGWVPRIEPGLLAFYDDLRKSKGGVGAAALKGSMCLGCHMQLPAQEVARVRAAEGLSRCDECGRILVVTDG